MSTITEDKVMMVWKWCEDAYSRQGMKIKFPKNTDHRRTYQWRFASSICQKFTDWNFDDETSIKFINIAVEQAKKRGLICKGLAALHQSNMLNICYNILTSQHKDNNNTIDSLRLMREWFDGQVGYDDPISILLARRNSRSYPNIIIWYQASKLSDLFLSLSKACRRAIAKIDNPLESRMLPATTTLYLMRLEFTSEENNLRAVRNLFGIDWRK